MSPHPPPTPAAREPPQGFRIWKARGPGRPSTKPCCLRRGSGDGVAHRVMGTGERRPREAHADLAQQRRRRRFQPRPPARGARGTQGEPLRELRGAGKRGGDGIRGGNEVCSHQGSCGLSRPQRRSGCTVEGPR